MDKHIMVGADVHDKSMLLKIAEGRGKPQTRSFANTAEGRRAMIRHLKDCAAVAGGARIVLAYEASSFGFGLYDSLCEAGIECHVLAPTKIARSADHRRRKTDERDAEALLEILRGHYLAGNALPSVWVPDPETRDDREIVRARLGVAEKLTALKAQIRMLLKRNGLQTPARAGKGWTKTYRAWLRGLAGRPGDLRYGACVALGTLLRQLAAIEEEIAHLDDHVQAMTETARYAEPARALMAEKGVGVLTAMVFLAEMGDLSRFRNRKQIGAFLGLVPSSNESGESGERKGHITHQGPWRVRRVLCQATWARVRTDPDEEAAYQRIVKRNPKHKKIAVVALMRRLAVRLWHLGRDAQRRENCFIAAA
jgi:transposase